MIMLQVKIRLNRGEI